ncbi:MULTISPECIES: SHOCT domain-containing protein [Xanthobacteraceae]|jgi:putative membrane protein|uniref:Membrane protein n=1 Tax=Xanthobacter flavus TaxID=281 RepID=A0A9W6CNB1_XANFL|nr:MULTISPECIES: SHOCT domain-containing protein [Xanthobacter]MBN8918129.1 hypothetical protein [Hyphomicrobiales bacterium]MBP2147537.1 putative membrane protein [Xanthobacter flavus]MCG5238140.1 hypothetical protein [Xanthobacter oligotrophicus]MDI4663330.1 hypothetical protein [Xanthobacter autotrophicus]MDR6336855.1 putative membrane protein [Xanthobacter flavus]
MDADGILSFLLLVLLTVGIVALVLSFFGGAVRIGNDRSLSRGLDILGEYCAKGEIQRDEYLQEKRDLSA